MHTLIHQAAAILASAQHLVVLTGAGISKESGIPTFREAQEGLWDRHDPERLATLSGFMANPQLVWDWYQYRLDKVKACGPNPGHYAVARLEEVLPRVVVVTQNVDSLHRLARSSDVLELHGNLRRFKCLRGHRGLTLDDLGGQEPMPPICPRPGCNALVRPDVVWFGEMLDEDVIRRAYAESQACDVMLIVGTSGVVTPAANLPYIARRTGARIVEVNPQPSGLTHLADVYLAGAAGEILPQVIEAMRIGT